MSNNDGAPDTSPPLLDKMVALPAVQVAAQQRYIWGIIDSTGGITASSDDFSVNHSGTGVYAITFNTAFANPPSPTTTPDGAGLAAIVRASMNSATVLTIHVFNLAGSAADQPFSFTATGI